MGVREEQEQRRLANRAVSEYIAFMSRKYKGNWKRILREEEGVEITNDNIEAIALEWKKNQP